LGLLEFPLILPTVIGLDTYSVVLICYAIVGITSGIFALMLYTEYFRDSMWLGGIITTFALVGSLIITRGVMHNLSIHRFLEFKLINAGFSLIGLWLLGVIFLTGYLKQLPRSLVVLGLVIGVVMTLSYFATQGWEPWLKYPWLQFLQGEIHFEDMPDWSRWFFYPVWCIFLGRYLVRKN